MKSPKRLLIGLATFLIGVLAAAVWSNYLGRRVWSPRVFAWRNPLRHLPEIDLAPDCPLLISNPRYFLRGNWLIHRRSAAFRHYQQEQ
jgi:hypothetical protein